MRVFSTNGGSTMCRPHPIDNQTRNALACLIAALSGVQMVGLRTMDEVLGIPSQEAVLASIRTQEIVAWEANLRSVVDPLGGSYYLEWLTSEMEERIRKEIETIDAMGGMVRAIESGYVQRTIMEDAYQAQRQFESGELVRVGVNKFVAEKKEHQTMKPYQFNPEDEAEQRRAVGELRARRDSARSGGALDTVRKAAASEENVMPAIIEAVEAYATMGEICGALKDVFGEYKEPSLF